MMLNQVTGQAGAHQRRKRVGRGESSGHGKTCGRGNKGCQSRSGGGTRPLHEGGQMPIFRRLPKRGFSNFVFRTEYQIVNLAALDANFESGQTVDLAALRGRGLISGADPQVKVLGAGELSKPLTVAVPACSAKARAAIEQARGTVQLLARPERAAQAKAKRNTAKKKPAPPAAGS